MAAAGKLSGEILRHTLESEPWTSHFCSKQKASQKFSSPGSPVVSPALLSLLAFTDGRVLFWSITENALISSRLKELELQRTAIVECDVDPLSEANSILPSPAGCSVALVGNRGVSILDVGSDSVAPESGRYVGRCITVAERFFLNNPKLTVLQFQWLPARETHVAVLTSDNHLRIYKINKPAQAELTISLHGAAAKRSLHNFSAFTVVLANDSRAENVPGSPSVEHRGSYTVFVLRSDGNVYTCDLSVGNERVVGSAIRGPLNAVPPFGADISQLASSILVIDAELPVVVVSTTAGKIYHGVVLENEGSEEGTDSLTTQEHSVASFGELIFIERLELSNSASQLTKKRGPFKLLSNPLFPSCYVIANGRQLLGISLPWLDDLSLLVSGGVDLDSLKPSAVKTVISLDPFETADDIRLLGAQLVATSSNEFSLVSVASNGQVTVQTVSRPAPRSRSQKKQEKPALKSEADWVTKKAHSAVPFGDLIASILRRDSSLPVFSFADPDRVTGSELDALVRQAIKVFDDQYLAKQRQAYEEILARKSKLEQRKKHIAELLDNVENNVQIRKDEHDDFVSESCLIEAEGDRLHDGISSLQDVFSDFNPTLTDAEKQLEQNLHDMASKINELEETIDSVQSKLAYKNKISSSSHSAERQEDAEDALLTSEICRIESLKRRIGFLRAKLDF